MPGGSFDVPGKLEALEGLREQAAAPNLWDDQKRAREVTRTLSRFENIVEQVDRLGAAIDDAETLLELASEEDDASAAADVVSELAAAGAELVSVAPLRITLEDVFVERVAGDPRSGGAGEVSS